MSNPVRQHWVPRAYLRAFCAQPVDREQIYAHDLKSGNAFLTSIDRVAVKKHFYTLGLESGSPSFAVEEAFGEIEAAAAPILSEIRRDEALPTGERLQVLARFVGIQHMRSRQGLQAIHGWRDDVGANSELYSVDEYHKVELERSSHEEMRELFAKSAVVVGARIGDRMLNFTWRLVRAEQGYFFTSENPVFCFHPSEERWGLETPGTHTLFPLSPKLLLHISPQPVLAGTGTVDASANAVRGINGLILLGAEQFLYSDRPFNEVKGLLQERSAGSRRAFGPA